MFSSFHVQISILQLELFNLHSIILIIYHNAYNQSAIFLQQLLSFAFIHTSFVRHKAIFVSPTTAIDELLAVTLVHIVVPAWNISLTQTHYCLKVTDIAPFLNYLSTISQASKTTCTIMKKYHSIRVFHIEETHQVLPIPPSNSIYVSPGLYAFPLQSQQIASGACSCIHIII